MTNLVPQKALDIEKASALKKPKYLGKDYMLMPKLDGWYGYVDVVYGVAGPITSRQRNVIQSLRELSKQIQNKFPQRTGRLLFEILVYDEQGKRLEFEVLNGILNRKGVCQYRVVLHIHDFIEDVDIPKLARYTECMIIYETVCECDFFELIPCLGITRNVTEETVQHQWRTMMHQALDDGHEGIIMCDVDAGYSSGKRNADYLKWKEECTYDLLCIGVEEGLNKGTLGSIVLRDSKGVRITVSGIKDELKRKWWSNPDTIRGKIVEVKAKNVNKDGTLREPRFKAERHDKTMPDTIRRHTEKVEHGEM